MLARWNAESSSEVGCGRRVSRRVVGVERIGQAVIIIEGKSRLFRVRNILILEPEIPVPVPTIPSGLNRRFRLLPG